MSAQNSNLGWDDRIILDLITPEAAVLDLGCGNGGLLALLVERKNVKAQGIELDDKSVLACVAKGLNVFHDDIDTGLPEYGDKSFGFVIMNQTLQQVKRPDTVLQEALRVGEKVIVGIPNFASLGARAQMFFGGRAPVTPALPYEWHDTPNLHFLSLLDFQEYCKKRKILIEEARYVGRTRPVWLFPNVFAQTGIFVISKRADKNE